MADNLTTQSTTPATVPSASVIATDDVSGVHYQKFKLDVGGDGVSVPVTGDGTNGLDVDVTRVQGTVTVGDGGGTISVDDGGGTITVDGTVGISGTVPVSGTFYQATQPVSGTVAVTGAYQATQPVSLATAPTTPVTGTFWQATQPVSGTVTATGPLTDTELRLTAVPVSLATAPTTPVTGTFWQATQPVSGTVTATGPLTDTQLRASAVPVSGSVTISDGSGPVTVDGTVAVTGALTDTELRATPLPVSGSVTISDGSGPVTVDGTVAVSGTVPVSGPLTDTQLRTTAVPVSLATAPTTPVTGTFWQTTQPVSGTVTATPTGTQNVDVTANTIGLATGANQTTGNNSLGSIDTKTPALGQALAAGSIPVVLTAAQVSTLTPPASITGFATDTTLNLIKDTDGIKKITDPLPTGTNSIGTVSTTPAVVNVGQQTVNTTAVQITAASTVPTNGILVGALSTNSAPIFIGGSGVTTSNGAELLPGASMPFTCNLNTLYIRSAASTADKIWWSVA